MASPNLSLSGAWSEDTTNYTDYTSTFGYSYEVTTPCSTKPIAPSREIAILLGAVESLIAVIVIVGNILVILSVYTNRKLRTITNLFVVSLAFADLMVGALVLPLAIKVQVQETTIWTLGVPLCKIWRSLDVLLCTASILNLCCISIDRYFAITRPIVCATKRSKRLASMMIGAVWILSAIITVPPLFGWKSDDGKSRDCFECQLNDNHGYVIFSAMGSFYIPLVIMLFVYVNIFVVARKAQRKWRSGSCRSIHVPPPSPSRRGSSYALSAGDSGTHGGGGQVVTRVKTVRVMSKRSVGIWWWCCCCCLDDGLGIRTSFSSTVADDLSVTKRDRMTRYEDARHSPGLSYSAAATVASGLNSRPTSVASENRSSTTTSDTRPSKPQSDAVVTSPASESRSSTIDFRPPTTDSTPPTVADSDKTQQITPGVGTGLPASDSDTVSAVVPTDTGRQTLTRTVGGAQDPDVGDLCCNNNSTKKRSATFNVTEKPGWRRSPSVNSVTLGQRSGNASTVTAADARIKDPRASTSASFPMYIRSIRSSWTCGNRSSADGVFYSRQKKTRETDIINKDRYRAGVNRHSCHWYLGRITPRHDIAPCQETAAEEKKDGAVAKQREFSDARLRIDSRFTGFVSAKEAVDSTAANNHARTNDHHNPSARKSSGDVTSTRPTTHQISRMSQQKTLERRENSVVMRERKTAKTVSIVIGCFVLCWLPFFIVYISEPFFVDGTFSVTVIEVFTWLGYINSAINPFIYAFYNYDFRWTFWYLTFGRVCRPGRLLQGVAPSSPKHTTRYQSTIRGHSLATLERFVGDGDTK